ncbi:MAG TPA: VC0807 family protein [Rhizomicrobium sp.]|jgi:hypothetical protein|nr:VC0807 family protein [Rhizomicrobium sp.]
MSRVRLAFETVRRNGVRIGTEILINFALPYLIYSLLQPKFGDVKALIASSAPPMLWSIGEFFRHRRVDAVSMLALGGIVLSLLAYIGGRGVKFPQLREKLVTVIIAAVFLGSAAIGKPLIYQLARAGMQRNNNSVELERFERIRDDAGFKRVMMLMTLVWGFGLLADAAVSVALVFVLPIKTYLIVNPALGYTTMGALFAWTFWCSRKKRAEGEARRAAEEATNAVPASLSTTTAAD